MTRHSCCRFSQTGWMFLPLVALTIISILTGCKPPAGTASNNSAPTTPTTPTTSGTNAAASHTEHGPTVTLTSANFDELVLKSDKPVLVDFWAPWCGPCVALAPTVGELAGDYEGKVTVGKLNVDEAKDIAQKYNISGIPALLVFKGGEVVDQIVGLKPKETLAKMLDKVAN